MRRTILPRCPWCHEPAKVLEATRAAIAHGAALLMAVDRGLHEPRLRIGTAERSRRLSAHHGHGVPAAAIREWRKILLPTTRITKPRNNGDSTRQRPLRSGTAGGSIDDP